MPKEEAGLYLFGIRHHGPGSARSVRKALEDLAPDMVLVEGPPEAEAVLTLLVHPEMKPPVALLLYVPETPRRAVYFPFTMFSPEWQAIEYALTQDRPVRFMDLPQTYQLAQDALAALAEQAAKETPSNPIRQDPIRALAEAAGYSESERWWEHMVEQRQESATLFAAIQEAMAALREAAGPETDPRELQRESFMRRTIRQAKKEGYRKIAVVCGAWHGPALCDLSTVKADDALLEGLPKTKVAATWVPWTNGRLCRDSGYGAGIEAPGWYHHLWTCPDDIVARWVIRVAHLLRAEDLEASPASAIEAIRLAETLAALRGRPLPGLLELNEAVQTVFCFGNGLPLRLVHQKLMVGETLGSVPTETPTVPLQQDLERLQRRLRLTPEATQRLLDLDLRKENDLERSRLLHRLNILDIPWGQSERQGGVGKGTFHEIWSLQWHPEFAVGLIEASLWGTTLLEAAEARARDRAETSSALATLTALLDKALLADLPNAVRWLMERLGAEAALAADVAHLMDALPPLVSVLRYGNVRRTDTDAVGQVVDGLVVRISIGLPSACFSLNDEAAAAMFARILAVQGAMTLLQKPEHLDLWQQTLAQMVGRENLHGLLAGRCSRLLLDAGVCSSEETACQLSLALSAASDPAQAAAWVEGFLKDSGQILLHNAVLWSLLDHWVTSLTPEAFEPLLPLLRRTFSTFTPPQRRLIGERVKDGVAMPAMAADTEYQAFDLDRAAEVLPLIAQLLGLSSSTERLV